MRKLIVLRKKTFVGCIAKVKIYAEDPAGDTNIGGVKCRLLGKLKNGEKATFEIGNESTKIFAIYDKMSKDYCNDYYTVPAGEEDCEISGKAHFNPFAGNPFYFDGVTDEVVLANRKKNSRKAMAIAIPLIIVAAAAGFAIGYYLVRF